MNRPLPLLLVTGLAFGCNFPLGKLAAQAGIHPALWAAVICLGAGLAVLAAASAFERSPPVPGVLRYASISSVISNVVPLTLTFAAIPHIGSGLAAILVATSPVTTALLSMALKVRPPGLLGLAGIAVGLAGAVIIIIGRNAGVSGAEARWLFLAALIPVFLGIGNVYRSMAWPPGAAPMRLGAAINLAAVPPLLIIVLVWGGLDLAPLLKVPGPCGGTARGLDRHVPHILPPPGGGRAHLSLADRLCGGGGRRGRRRGLPRRALPAHGLGGCCGGGLWHRACHDCAGQGGQAGRPALTSRAFFTGIAETPLL
jgi:drug/metabolite transporter (DMT)-like permease